MEEVLQEQDLGEKGEDKEPVVEEGWREEDEEVEI